MLLRVRPYIVAVVTMLTLSSCLGSSHPKTKQSSTKTPSTTTTAPSSTTTTILHRLAAPSGFEPASVSFVSQSDGFVLGTAKSCATTSCAFIVTTTNNGATWQQMPPPPVPYVSRPHASTTSSGISQIRFANIDNGWAFGPSLYATHNSGASWQKVQVPVPGKVVTLATAGGKVFAVVANCNPQTNTCSSSLVTSSISSNSFTQVPGATNIAASVQLWNGFPITLYATPNGVNGFVSLGYQGNYASGKPLLYATNGGGTWSRFPDPCAGTNLQIASLAMPNAATLDTLCSGQPAAGSTKKVLMQTYHSQTRRLGNPPFSGDGNLQLASPNTSRIVIAGASAAGFIYRSTNNGQSWKTYLYQDGGVSFYDFGFTTPTQGVAIHGFPANHAVDNLIESTNGGASWHTVPIP